MRPIPSFFAALITLTALAACGTKTALSLPPQAPVATAAPPAPSHQGIPLRITPAADNSNNTATEPRQ